MGRKSALSITAFGAGLLALGITATQYFHVESSSVPMEIPPNSKIFLIAGHEDQLQMTTLTSQIDAFVASQNTNRGLAGEEVALDYDVLTGTVPAGGNSITGISTIAAGAAPIAFSSGYNGLILEGAHSTTAAASGQPDNIGISVAANGTVTLVDENTGNTETVSGVNYLIFDGAATTSGGAFQSIVMIESGTNAQIAALYNAALGRQPDLAGLEYYAVRLADGELTLQQEAANFIASPEFLSRFAAASLPSDGGGPNDQAFVTAMYANVLHRSASASEIAYYAAALQNGEAGSIVNQANPVEWSRAQELINFATSPENQTDISGWLINTGNGAYSDPGLELPGMVDVSTALNVSSGGTIDTSAINSSTISGTYVSVNGGWSSTGTGGVSLATSVSSALSTQFSGGEIYSSENNITIDLSTQYASANFANASNDTIHGASTGGGLFTFQNIVPSGGQDQLFEGAGNTLYLSGSGNVLFAQNVPVFGTSHAVPGVLAVYGATTGDSIEFNNQNGRVPNSAGPQVDIIGTPAAGTTIQGSAFLSPAFGTSSPTPAGYYFVDTTIAINVGSVADNSAATMAAAAAKVYTPTATGTGLVTGQQESVVFFGQGANNDTVIYKWFADSTHEVSAATMIAGLDLIGVTPTQFEAMLKF